MEPPPGAVAALWRLGLSPSLTPRCSGESAHKPADIIVAQPGILAAELTGVVRQDSLARVRGRAIMLTR